MTFPHAGPGEDRHPAGVTLTFMSEESADLERRLRENKGRLLWPEFAEALSEVLPASDLESHRLSVAATDALRASFFKRIGSDPYIEYVLFHHLDRLTGAILVDGAAVLSGAGRIWEVVREDLCLASRDLEHGLCLELNHYSRGDELELVSWGALVPKLG